MANIPVRILQDKNKHPFFPMSVLESIFVNGTDKNLKQVLEEIYTKEEIDLLMLTLLSRFKTANSVSELPTTDVTDGNVYVVHNGKKCTTITKVLGECLHKKVLRSNTTGVVQN